MLSRKELANAIRALSMDAVQRANSGHPGMPMGMADIAEVLWNDYLRHNPQNPKWWDRDRFVVSNGHGSMLLYSLLHLAGYELSIEDLKDFRQLHSKTPGHPEYSITPGVETTTGPLGQGLSNGVGLAMAERALATKYNKPDTKIVDHYTYVFAGDGCLMEGISHEVCSFAGTMGLGKLIVFYDDNGISIDGRVENWFTDNTPQRFEAYGWHVVADVDGHNPESLKAAIEEARANTDKPSLLCCKTLIGYGSPNKVDTAGAHGAPLGDDEIVATREQLGWTHEPFVVPDEIYKGWDATTRGGAQEADWQQRWDVYQQRYPGLADELQRRMDGEMPVDWTSHTEKVIQELQQASSSDATRKSSAKVLEAFAPMLPEMLGGSADLTGSNKTKWSGSEPMSKEKPDANYIYYGVREFGMTGIANGLSLHGGFIPYTGTFLVFSDYARNAVRLSALMGIQSILVYTHDSIGLGEDGPTHQPVEHTYSLELIPKMSVWRPCDAVETAVAWKVAIEHRQGPTALLLTRQGLPGQNRDDATLSQIARGGYILEDCKGQPDVILLASGSEVSLIVDAAVKLRDAGHKVRVVSMPSRTQFAAQDQDYQDSVLPPSVQQRVAVEAGVSAAWYRYVGPQGAIVGLDQFGESAPAKTLFAHFGFTADAIAEKAAALL